MTRPASRSRVGDRGRVHRTAPAALPLMLSLSKHELGGTRRVPSLGARRLRWCEQERSDEMPVNVRMPDILAERSRSGQLRLAKPYREGLTAGDVVAEEGFSADEAEAILVMVNGVQAERSTPVRDGDTVELVIQMVGGQ